MKAEIQSKLVIVARETHVAHNSDDVRDPSPQVALFEHVLGLFNEFIYNSKPHDILFYIHENFRNIINVISEDDIKDVLEEMSTQCEDIDQVCQYPYKIEILKRMLKNAGFRVYVFEHPVYELVLFVKITDNLYAIVVSPWERDLDVPVLHPIYIYCTDKRIERPWIAQLVTYFWLDKVREKDHRISDGLDEVHIEFDFERRRAKCKRVPVYRSRKDKLLASSSL